MCLPYKRTKTVCLLVLFASALVGDAIIIIIARQSTAVVWFDFLPELILFYFNFIYLYHFLFLPLLTLPILNLTHPYFGTTTLFLCRCHQSFQTITATSQETVQVLDLDTNLTLLALVLQSLYGDISRYGVLLLIMELYSRCFFSGRYFSLLTCASHSFIHA